MFKRRVHARSAHPERRRRGASIAATAAAVNAWTASRWWWCSEPVRKSRADSRTSRPTRVFLRPEAPEGLGSPVLSWPPARTRAATASTTVGPPPHATRQVRGAVLRRAQSCVRGPPAVPRPLDGEAPSKGLTAQRTDVAHKTARWQGVREIGPARCSDARCCRSASRAASRPAARRISAGTYEYARPRRFSRLG